MKKKWIVLLVIVIVLVAAVITWVLFFPVSLFKNTSSDNVNALQTEIDIINKYPTDMIVYGDKIDFAQTGISIRTIDSITEKNLERSSKYIYSYIIINDMNNNIKLTDGEINLIYDYIYKKGYNLIYFGTQYYAVWNDPLQAIADIDESHAVAYQCENGNIVRVVGMWTNQELEIYKDDSTILSDTIIMQVADMIERNN